MMADYLYALIAVFVGMVTTVLISTTAVLLLMLLGCLLTKGDEHD